MGGWKDSGWDEWVDEKESWMWWIGSGVRNVRVEPSTFVGEEKLSGMRELHG